MIADFLRSLARQLKERPADAAWPLVVTLLCVRLAVIASPVFEQLLSLGDYRHFYNLAQLAVDGRGGLPFLNHWVEFPPIFPYLSLAIYRLCAGEYTLYARWLSLLMTACDMGSLLIFVQLSRQHGVKVRARAATLAYVVFLGIPVFGWWTFEPMAVLALLIAVKAILDSKPVKAGLTAGLGFLTKVFPLLSLVLAWGFRPRREAAWCTLSAMLVIILVLAPLFLASPTFTVASLRAQLSKGSWQTLWALLDGNRATGLFGPLAERTDPQAAGQVRGNPATIPTWLLLIAGMAILSWVALRMNAQGELNAIAFLGLTFCVFFLVSPGWSPQWMAYLTPLVLLCLPSSPAFGLWFALAAVSLLEWPILLSHGLFGSLYVTVPIRTLLMAALAFIFGRTVLRSSQARTHGIPR